MKKILSLLLVALLALSVAACGQDNADSPKKEPSNTDATDKKEDSKNKPLTEVGQVTTDELGTFELVKIINPEKEIDLSPVKLTIHNIKLIKGTKLSDDFIRHVKTSRIEPKEPLALIQIEYTAENTTDDNIHFTAISNLVTSSKEQLDDSQDLIMEQEIEFLGKVKSETHVLFPLKSSVDEIDSLKVITDDVTDKDFNILKDAHTEEFELK